MSNFKDQFTVIDGKPVPTVIAQKRGLPDQSGPFRCIGEVHGEGTPTGKKCECGGELYSWEYYGYDDKGVVDRKELKCNKCDKVYPMSHLNFIDRLKMKLKDGWF